jgi:hypothetical protein
MLQTVTAEVNNRKDDICAARQVGARTGLPQKAVYRLISEGKIPVIRCGRTKYVNCTLLRDELASGKGTLFERNLPMSTDKVAPYR